MKCLTIALAMCAVLLLCCNCSVFNKLNMAQNVYDAATSVSYTTLDNYFVRNDVNHNKRQDLILTNKADFEGFFGMAATMGGLPTDINWNKQYVVAVVLPETNRMTTVTPIDVRQDGNKVVFCYKVDRGEKTTYTMMPFTAVALDKPTNSQQMEFFFLEK